MLCSSPAGVSNLWNNTDDQLYTAAYSLAYISVGLFLLFFIMLLLHRRVVSEMKHPGA
jgi:hypothetical protein